MNPHARYILWNVVVLPLATGAILGLMLVTLTCHHEKPVQVAVTLAADFPMDRVDFATRLARDFALYNARTGT